MRPLNRFKSERDWRAGQDELCRLQKLVDILISKIDENEMIEIKDAIGSGLFDLKLRINKEMRENWVSEIAARKKFIELNDQTLAARSGVGVIQKIQAQLLEKTGQLMMMDDMKKIREILAGDMNRREMRNDLKAAVTDAGIKMSTAGGGMSNGNNDSDVTERTVDASGEPWLLGEEAEQIIEAALKEEEEKKS